jgi:hypothetical protein
MYKIRYYLGAFILFTSIAASGSVVIVGWDTFTDVGTGTDTYNATYTNGASGQAVGTAAAGEDGWANFGSATLNNGASADGTWGTLTGDVLPSVSTASSTSAVGLVNATSSGELTFTVTNTSGSFLDLASFNFDGYKVRPKAAGNWQLSIMPGSDLTVGVLASGTLISAGGAAMPNDGSEDYDISLIALADNRLEIGETAVFQLALSGGAGDDAGGNNAMIDNVAVMAVPEPSTYALLAGFLALGVIIIRRRVRA